MPALLVIVAVAVVFIAAIWLVRKRVADPMERLVASCYGDRAMAERLVARERERHPALDDRKLIARAIERLVDDRSR